MGKRVVWKGAIEERRKELRRMGIGPTKSAHILSNEFNTKVTKDMVAGRERVSNQTKNNRKHKKNFEQNNTKVKVQNDNGMQFFSEQDVTDSTKYLKIEKVKKELADIYNIFNDSKPKKILSLSDIHSPYADIKNIDRAIKENLDADIVLISGDLLDNEAMGNYDNITEWEISEEFGQVRKILNVLNDNFKHIVVIEGNHEGRFSRYVCKNIKPSLRDFAIDRLNPLKYITEKYENIKLVNFNTVQIGSCVFKHPHKYNNQEMKTIVNEREILKANSDLLPNENFNLIMIGHTHMAGEYFYNDVKLIEQGCLCQTPDYRVNEPTKRRWVSGYGIVYLNEKGIADLNRSRFIFLE